jgi:hypothetical protein
VVPAPQEALHSFVGVLRLEVKGVSLAGMKVEDLKGVGSTSFLGNSRRSSTPSSSTTTRMKHKRAK